MKEENIMKLNEQDKDTIRRLLKECLDLDGEEELPLELNLMSEGIIVKVSAEWVDEDSFTDFMEESNQDPVYLCHYCKQGFVTEKEWLSHGCKEATS